MRYSYTIENPPVEEPCESTPRVETATPEEFAREREVMHNLFPPGSKYRGVLITESGVTSPFPTYYLRSGQTTIYESEELPQETHAGVEVRSEVREAYDRYLNIVAEHFEAYLPPAVLLAMCTARVLRYPELRYFQTDTAPLASDLGFWACRVQYSTLGKHYQSRLIYAVDPVEGLARAFVGAMLGLENEDYNFSIEAIKQLSQEAL